MAASRGILTCSSLYCGPIRIIPPRGHDLGKFCVISALREGQTSKNNIRSTVGTPLDSGRFRQACPTLERIDVLTSIVVSIVKSCTRFASLTVLVALILAIAAGYYTSQNFQINTDINTLISAKLDWRQRDNQFDKAFDRDSTILAVVEAPTPELTSAASAALAQKLAGDAKHFSSVQPLGSGEFFEKNGLLYSARGRSEGTDRPVCLGSPPDRDHGRRSLDPRPDRRA